MWRAWCAWPQVRLSYDYKHASNANAKVTERVMSVNMETGREVRARDCW